MDSDIESGVGTGSAGSAGSAVAPGTGLGSDLGTTFPRTISDSDDLEISFLPEGGLVGIQNSTRPCTVLNNPADQSVIAQTSRPTSNTVVTCELQGAKTAPLPAALNPKTGVTREIVNIPNKKPLHIQIAAVVTLDIANLEQLRHLRQCFAKSTANSIHRAGEEVLWLRHIIGTSVEFTGFLSCCNNRYSSIRFCFDNGGFFVCVSTQLIDTLHHFLLPAPVLEQLESKYISVTSYRDTMLLLEQISKLRNTKTEVLVLSWDSLSKPQKCSVAETLEVAIQNPEKYDNEDDVSTALKGICSTSALFMQKYKDVTLFDSCKFCFVSSSLLFCASITVAEPSRTRTPSAAVPHDIQLKKSAGSHNSSQNISTTSRSSPSLQTKKDDMITLKKIVHKYSLQNRTPTSQRFSSAHSRESGLEVPPIGRVGQVPPIGRPSRQDPSSSRRFGRDRPLRPVTYAKMASALSTREQLSLNDCPSFTFSFKTDFKRTEQYKSYLMYYPVYSGYDEVVFCFSKEEEYVCMLHELNSGTNSISIPKAVLSCYGFSQVPPSFLDSVKILFQSSLAELNNSVLNLPWAALTRTQMVTLFQERCQKKSLPDLEDKGDLQVASFLGANIRRSPDFVRQFGKAGKFDCAVFGFSTDTPLDCTWSLVDIPDTWEDTKRLKLMIDRVMIPLIPHNPSVDPHRKTISTSTSSTSIGKEGTNYDRVVILPTSKAPTKLDFKSSHSASGSMEGPPVQRAVHRISNVNLESDVIVFPSAAKGKLEKDKEDRNPQQATTHGNGASVQVRKDKAKSGEAAHAAIVGKEGDSKHDRVQEKVQEKVYEKVQGKEKEDVTPVLPFSHTKSPEAIREEKVEVKGKGLHEMDSNAEADNAFEDTEKKGAQDMSTAGAEGKFEIAPEDSEKEGTQDISTGGQGATIVEELKRDVIRHDVGIADEKLSEVEETLNDTEKEPPEAEETFTLREPSKAESGFDESNLLTALPFRVAFDPADHMFEIQRKQDHRDMLETDGCTCRVCDKVCTPKQILCCSLCQLKVHYKCYEMKFKNAKEEHVSGNLSSQALGNFNKCLQVKWFCIDCHHIETSDLLSILSLAIQGSQQPQRDICYTEGDTTSSNMSLSFSNISSEPDPGEVCDENQDNIVHTPNFTHSTPFQRKRSNLGRDKAVTEPLLGGIVEVIKQTLKEELGKEQQIKYVVKDADTQTGPEFNQTALYSTTLTAGLAKEPPQPVKNSPCPTPDTPRGSTRPAQQNPKTTVIVRNVKRRNFIKSYGAILRQFNGHFPFMKVMYAHPTRGGSLVIGLKDEEDANKVAKMWLPHYFTLHKSDNSVPRAERTSCILAEDLRTRALLKGIDKHFTDEMLTSIVQERYQGSEAKRFVTREGKKLETVMITFKSSTQLDSALSDQIAVGHSIHNLEEYIPRRKVIQCHNCRKFDHVSKFCKSTRACLYCGKDHEDDSCSVMRSLSRHKCSNCSGNHRADSEHCPNYREKLAYLNTLPSHHG